MLTCISTQKDSCSVFYFYFFAVLFCLVFFVNTYTLTKLTLTYLFDNKILKCILLFCIVNTVNIVNKLFI